MPRDASGNYSLPSGNPVVSGTTIESTWANDTMTDLANGMTESLSRLGNGGMQGPLLLSDGSSAIPAWSWVSDVDTGCYWFGDGEIRFTSNGIDQIRFYSGAVNFLFDQETNGKIKLPNTTLPSVRFGVIEGINGSGQDSIYIGARDSETDGAWIRLYGVAADSNLNLLQMGGGGQTSPALIINENNKVTITDEFQLNGDLSAGSAQIDDLTIDSLLTVNGFADFFDGVAFDETVDFNGIVGFYDETEYYSTSYHFAPVEFEDIVSFNGDVDFNNPVEFKSGVDFADVTTFEDSVVADGEMILRNSDLTSRFGTIRGINSTDSDNVLITASTTIAVGPSIELSGNLATTDPNEIKFRTAGPEEIMTVKDDGIEAYKEIRFWNEPNVLVSAIRSGAALEERLVMCGGSDVTEGAYIILHGNSDDADAGWIEFGQSSTAGMYLEGSELRIRNIGGGFEAVIPRLVGRDQGVSANFAQTWFNRVITISAPGVTVNFDLIFGERGYFSEFTTGADAATLTSGTVQLVLLDGTGPVSSITMSAYAFARVYYISSNLYHVTGTNLIGVP